MRSIRGDGMRCYLVLTFGIWAGLALSGPAMAQTCGPQMRVEFFESSPKDLFIIGNVSAPGWRVTDLAILLDGSRGALLFDTEFGGAGLSVYQPLEIAESDIPVRLAEVQDGSRVMTLSFDPAQPLAPGGELTVTIDLDDTVQLADLGPTIISGNEIEGARVTATAVGREGQKTQINGVFDRQGVALTDGFACS